MLHFNILPLLELEAASVTLTVRPIVLALAQALLQPLSSI